MSVSYDAGGTVYIGQLSTGEPCVRMKCHGDEYIVPLAFPLMLAKDALTYAKEAPQSTDERNP